LRNRRLRRASWNQSSKEATTNLFTLADETDMVRVELPFLMLLVLIMMMSIPAILAI
jgi:hypothetical protein